MNLFKVRLETLAKQIRYHAQIYYRQDKSEISDADYDLLVQEYNQIINDHPELLTPDVDVYRDQAVPIDEEESKFTKVKHEPAMLSLANVFSPDQHADWTEKLPEESRGDLVDEWKFDGIALRLVYIGGKLDKILTRGTGLIGEDVTEALPYYENIPSELAGAYVNEDSEIMIDGEGVIELSMYDRINDVVPTPYITPRHAASGITRNRSLGDVVNGSLTFIAHTFPRVMEHDYDATMQALRDCGFRTAADYPVDTITVERPVHIPYAIDGIVTKIKSQEARNKLGATNHHPRWAIAYKFPTLKESSKLEDVVWETGRTGNVTPVAEFAPVQIAGVTVRRATLHNFRAFQRSSEGLRVGSEVVIGMAGDIIPQFFEVTTVGKGRQCKSPKSCPSCEEPLHYEGTDGDQVFLRCTNHSGCPAQTFGRLLNFGGKFGMNIMGLGPASIKRFSDLGYLNNFVDLYRLRTVLGQQPLTKTEEKLLDAIDDSRETNLIRFITALGINGVGKGTAKALATELSDPETLLDDLCDTKRLSDIKDIGWGIALNCAAYVKVHRAPLEALMKELTFTSIEIPTDLRPVCVTGKFPFRRKALAHELLTHGFEVTDKVNSKTVTVVAGEHPTKHKLETAKTLDVPVVHLTIHPELTVSEVVDIIKRC
ncbi:DNA ligase [Vibrio phage pTD1]|uniref:DNA ligase (NAD(+)) n=1 Tax=Vibrio phage pTD1 TaxID=1938577 RepID=A0A1Q2U2Q6_9CAUD|nr:NAD-dependent DNA ligase [Vibrio phage pTD1]BAW98247.1 DNA ligase [Vibrio phage pTD1]